MKMLDALRGRRPHGDAPDEKAAELAILGYDMLDHRGVGVRLDLLTQTELEAVETYERSHADRRQVLDGLRHMRMRMAVSPDE